jgi:hypothetical protein
MWGWPGMIRGVGPRPPETAPDRRRPAAPAMQPILVESARREQRVKHGGGLQPRDPGEYDIPVTPPPEGLLALADTLARLAAVDAEADRIVEPHSVAGRSIDEAADPWVFRGRRPTGRGPTHGRGRAANWEARATRRNGETPRGPASHCLVGPTRRSAWPT